MFLSGYVTANLQSGEELTIDQLLHVLLIGSANDSANVLAEYVSGSIADFSILMNQKAKELGCTNSNFLNPSGDHDDNHYSTARDLSLIAQYAMQNETFRNIVCQTYYELPSTSQYPKEDRFFTNTNELLTVNTTNQADNYYYKYAIGVKTGFTTPAMNCLVAAANKNDLELITVVLGADQNSDGLSNRYVETIKMFKYGYSNYAMKNIGNSGDIVQTVNIKNATKDTKKLDIILEDGISVLAKNTDTTSIIPTITLKEDLKAPIKAGDIVGKISYNIEDIYYESNLLASNDVTPANHLLHILEIFVILVIIYIIIKLIIFISKRKKNR